MVRDAYTDLSQHRLSPVFVFTARSKLEFKHMLSYNNAILLGQCSKRLLSILQCSQCVLLLKSQAHGIDPATIATQLQKYYKQCLFPAGRTVLHTVLCAYCLGRKLLLRLLL